MVPCNQGKNGFFLSTTMSCGFILYWMVFFPIGFDADEIKSVVTVKSRDKFDLKNVRLDLEADVTASKLSAWTDLLRSDHSRFWYHNVDYPTSFPAVLITDTGEAITKRLKNVPFGALRSFRMWERYDSPVNGNLLRFSKVWLLNEPPSTFTWLWRNQPQKPANNFIDVQQKFLTLNISRKMSFPLFIKLRQRVDSDFLSNRKFLSSLKRRTGKWHGLPQGSL